MAAAPPAQPVVARRAAARLTAAGPGVVAVLYWLVLPVICLVGIGLGADRLSRHVNNVPAGIKGSYLVTSHSCQRQLCITSGTFTSDDGRMVEPNLLGDYRWQQAKKYRVVYNGTAADVIPLPARWDPTSTVVGMAGATALLGLWGWQVRRALRSRAAPVAGSDP